MASGRRVLSLSTFLKKARQTVGLSGIHGARAHGPGAGGSELGDGRMTFVMGNQASDLDSMVCCVVYSFFLQVRALSKGSRCRYSPLINIPRKHFRLRGDASEAFAQANIDVDSIPFLDDVDLKQMAESKSIEMVLVDHNKLSASQGFLSPHVVSIVDHHVDEKEYLSTTASRRNIHATGSCATLVALEILSSSVGSSVVCPEIAYLLSSVILVDTCNLDPKMNKTTQKDLDALALLEKKGGVLKKDYSKLFNKILNDRNDISNLSSEELLIKDTKFGLVNGLHFAIAGVGLDLRAWVFRDGKLIDAFQSFRKQHKLQFAMAMTVFTDSKGIFRREMMIVGSPSVTKHVEKSLLASDLKLSPISIGIGAPEKESEVYWCTFEQGNVKASRKQLMPLLKSILTHR
ncbi:hypothetical protein AAMO2058_000617900 [Amorphochlora amoebiformis]